MKSNLEIEDEVSDSLQKTTLTTRSRRTKKAALKKSLSQLDDRMDHGDDDEAVISDGQSQ
jgi:hypothetical protein